MKSFLKNLSASPLWLLPILTALTGCGLFYTPPKAPVPDAGVVQQQSIFRGLLLTHQTVNGYAVAQDDIILGEADRLAPASADQLAARTDLVASSNETYQWPDGQIPYSIPQGFQYASAAQAAVEHWNAKLTGVVHFVPRTDEADYLIFTPSDRCASYLGKIGGPQPIWVSSDCTAGNLIHQLGHAVGLMHEENRLDRDRHVRIHWDNLTASTVSHFDKTGNAQGTDVGSYDYASIMHSSALVASANGNATIEPINADSSTSTAIGQTTGLSDGDVANVTALYLRPHPPIVFALPPTIVTQPTDVSVQAGSSAAFTVTVSGTPSFVYQWYQNGTPVPGGTSAQLTLTNVQVSQAGYYWVRVSNDIGTAESQHVLLTVTAAIPPPPSHNGNGILTNNIPVFVSGTQTQQLVYTFDVPQGATQLSISISGGSGDADLYTRFGSAPTLSQYDCRPYLDGNAESCRVTYPQAGTYYVLVNGYNAFSNVQLLASYVGGTSGHPVTSAPIIFSQPQSVTLQVGANAYFWVNATGDGTLTYQWYGNGQPLYGQNASSLSLTNVQTYQSGAYYVVVSNAGGSTQSVAAQLTVQSPPPPPPPPGGSIALTNNVPVYGLSGNPGTELRYSIDVPAGAQVLSIRLQGGSGDADLYVRYASPPDTFHYDCISDGSSTWESCNNQYPLGGTYYILVRGYYAFSNVTLVASYNYQNTQPPPTQQSITLTGIFNPPPYGDPFNTNVMLSWTPVNGAEYYAIYRNGEWIGTSYGLSFQDDFIPSNYQAAYQVFALYGGQRIASSQVVLLSYGWPY